MILSYKVQNYDMFLFNLYEVNIFCTIQHNVLTPISFLLDICIPSGFKLVNDTESYNKPL